MEENWIGRWLYSMSKQSHSGNSMEFLKLGRAWEEADIWRAWQSLPAVPKNLPSGDTAVVWSSAPWWNSCAWRGRGITSWVWGKRWKKGTNMDKLFKELSKDVQRIHSSMLGCTFRPWSCKLPKNESERTLPFAALQGPKCYLCHPSLLLQGHSLQSFGTPKQFLPFLRQVCNHDMSRWMQYIVPWSPCFDASMDATASISVKLWSKDFKGLSIFEYWMGVSQLWIHLFCAKINLRDLGWYQIYRPAERPIVPRHP